VLEQTFAPTYQAGVARSGLWPAVSVLGIDVAPNTFAPWLLILAVFTGGIALITRQRPIIADLWSEESEDPPSPAPASVAA
jgi:hypothetical protein